MSFQVDLDEEARQTPEERKRMVERSAKWRAAMAVRELWSPEDHEKESERLQAEIAAFPVTRIPAPVWVPYDLPPGSSLSLM